MAGSDEVTGYVFAGATTWALAATLREKGNVRIDLIYGIVPAGVRAGLDLVSFLAIGLLLGFMANGALSVLGESWRLGSISVTPLQTPLAVPQAIWFAGLVLALLMWVAIALRLVAGGRAVLAPLIGARSVEEETEAELEALRRRGEGRVMVSPNGVGDAPTGGIAK